MTRPSIGDLIREQRRRTRRSQLDVALDAGVSARHLGFVELGRSRPSRELVSLLAHRLDVPLRERNQWMLAAGYAPAYAETALDDESIAPIAASLQRLLDAHDPYPGVVVDGTWTVQLTNRAAVRLVGGVADDVRGVPSNVFRICLHPEGLAARTTNFAEWSGYLLGQLDAAVARTGDPVLVELAEEVAAWPGIAPREQWRSARREASANPLVTWNLRDDDHELSFFTTIAVLAAPRDVTLAELAVELFYPADEQTAARLQRGQ